MKCIVRSKFLGRTPNGVTARKRMALVVASNENVTQFKLAVDGLPYAIWVDAKDVQFI